jgi:hypothetical protein
MSLAESLLDPDDHKIDPNNPDWRQKDVALAIRGAIFPEVSQDLARRIDYVLLHLDKNQLVDLYNNAAGMPYEEIKKRVSRVWN